jgi:hypothetical protein
MARLLKKLQISCKVPKKYVTLNDDDAYELQAVLKLKEFTEIKRLLVCGWLSVMNGETTDSKILYRMVTKYGMHKLRHLKDDSLIPTILSNWEDIVKNADPAFWREMDKIPTVQIDNKRVASFEWLN